VSRDVDGFQDKGGVGTASDVRVVSSSPCLGTSQAGNNLGSGLSLRFSICGTQPEPPASMENSQMTPLDPTIQLISPSNADVD
jgi:hypothetical protein